jgi:uncharacterized protein (DUF4415 family)
MRTPSKTRAPMSTRDAAEAAFKSATTKPPEQGAPKPPAILVSLTIPRDVLEHFQEPGPGWHDRIIAALRHAATR